MKKAWAWKTIPMFLAIALMVSGCGTIFASKQENAGIAHWNLKPDVECIKAAKSDRTLCYEVEVFDGKEKADVTISVERRADGSFLVSYNAEEVKAFEGQALRAAVHIEVAKALKDILPGMVDSLVTAIIKGVKPL